MFYLIGLGLATPDDISVRGFKVVKQCSYVYLEAYTSVLSEGHGLLELERYFDKPITLADREMVEQFADDMLDKCKGGADVCLLVVGDPLSATTHTDLITRAHARSVPFAVIHNASIMNAVAACGLQLYRFGETVSIVMWSDNWQPDSYYEKIMSNLKRGLHSLCLLDIKLNEISIEALMKKQKIREPPRFMLASEAAEQLLEIARRRNDTDTGMPSSEMCLSAETKCVAIARLGWPDQRIVYSTLGSVRSVDLGKPLHSLVICASDLHPVEEELLNIYAL